MDNFIFSVLYGAYSNWAQSILVVGLGVIFIIHGWPKIKNPRNFAGWLSSMNIKPGLFWALVVAIVEFFGGIILVIGSFVSAVGLFVPFVAMLLAVNMLVAIIKVKRKFVGGWEFDFILLVAAISLVFLG